MFDNLSIFARIADLQSLWDRIAASAESVALQEWRHGILDQRLSILMAILTAATTGMSFRKVSADAG